MKIRSGFVSNSSSSSFIVRADSVKHVAIACLKRWADDYLKETKGCVNIREFFDQLRETFNNNDIKEIQELKLKFENIEDDLEDLLHENDMVEYPSWVLDMINQAFDVLSILDDDAPVMIPWTCNYNTYIMKYDDNRIIVDTCNNTRWYESENLDIECSSDDIFSLVNMIPQPNPDFKFTEEESFTNLETGAVHRYYEEYN